jgi:hypothetical protein
MHAADTNAVFCAAERRSDMAGRSGRGMALRRLGKAKHHRKG